jgi:hypothetical protein
MDIDILSLKDSHYGNKDSLMGTCDLTWPDRRWLAVSSGKPCKTQQISQVLCRLSQICIDMYRFITLCHMEYLDPLDEDFFQSGIPLTKRSLDGRVCDALDILLVPWCFGLCSDGILGIHRESYLWEMPPVPAGLSNHVPLHKRRGVAWLTFA